MRWFGAGALLAAGLWLAALAAPAPLGAQVSRAAPASPARDSTLRSAERAARQWLWLLDDERYEQAWEVVVPAMRSLTGRGAWATSLRRLRTGTALPRSPTRGLLRAEPSGPLFGGSSVILSFSVGPGEAREIVVLVRSTERWLIGGYGILPY